MDSAAANKKCVMRWIIVAVLGLTGAYLLISHEKALRDLNLERNQGRINNRKTFTPASFDSNVDRKQEVPINRNIFPPSLNNSNLEKTQRRQNSREILLSRKTKLEKICSQPWVRKMKVIQPGRSKTVNLVEDHLKWCPIPTVATNYFNFIKLQVDQQVKKENNQKHGSQTPSQKSNSKFKSVVWVREPYSRMVSSYLEILVTQYPAWRKYNRNIIQLFRPKATPKMKYCGSDVTFPEFVKYFIHSQKTRLGKNDHFVPMHELCNPCKESFDFIGHLETSENEVSYILNYVNISTDLDFFNRKYSKMMMAKSRMFANRIRGIRKCEPACAFLRKVWWSFQVRGLISRNIQFPLGDGGCENIHPDELAQLISDARYKVKELIYDFKQKREFLVELFLQVPLEDRIQVRDILALDFKLFGYEAQPDDIFPELVKNYSPRPLNDELNDDEN